MPDPTTLDPDDTYLDRRPPGPLGRHRPGPPLRPLHRRRLRPLARRPDPTGHPRHGDPRPLPGTGVDERLATPEVKPITVAKNVSELRAFYAALTDTIHRTPPRPRLRPDALRADAPSSRPTPAPTSPPRPTSTPCSPRSTVAASGGATPR